MRVTDSLCLARRYRIRPLAAVALLTAACTLPPPDQRAAPAAKADDEQPGRETGWVADNSFEVGALVRGGRILVPASAVADDIASDRAAQDELIDRQLRYAKNDLYAHGYILNQLLDEVVGDPQVISHEDTGLVELRYAARVDVIGEKDDDDPVPALEDIAQRIFDDVRLPLDPLNVFRRAGVGQACASHYEGHSVSEYNLYYYFDPDAEGCAMAVGHPEPTLELIQPVVELVEVYAVRASYPEYDRLSHALDDAGFPGQVGFFAAVVPASDSGRFDDHKQTLEGDLGLDGEPWIVDATADSARLATEDEQDQATFWRYLLVRGSARIVIDLYRPAGSFEPLFRARLGQPPYGADGQPTSLSYQLVWYNGHSGYGSKHLLDHEEVYAPGYQIIGMHSCRSYAYYARQVFHAKADAEDPTGFADADVVATGESSYPSGSLRSLRVLLPQLLAGVYWLRVSEELGDGSWQYEAPSWQQIIGEINDRILGGSILYGVAGVRSNCWAPETPYCVE